MSGHPHKPLVGRLFIDIPMRLSDASCLTEVDRSRNDYADRLAKEAVEEHRVSESVRLALVEHEQLQVATFRWLANATLLANSQGEGPKRDSVASRQLAMGRRRKMGPRKARVKHVVARPVSLGGHRLGFCVGRWACVVCRVGSSSWRKMSPACCGGSIVAR